MSNRDGKGNLNTWIDANLLKQARVRAAELDVSLYKVIEEALSNHLTNSQPERPKPVYRMTRAERLEQAADLMAWLNNDRLLTLRQWDNGIRQYTDLRFWVVGPEGNKDGVIGIAIEAFANEDDAMVAARPDLA